MEVKYLYHSGVSVLAGETLLVFDYYKKGIDEEAIKEAGNVLVFVSHGHRDHFDKGIFKWRELNPGIRFILSSDIALERHADIFRIGADEELRFDGIVVRTLGSTDEGVAYVVETPEGVVFHSGDLNWWHWEGEPDEFNEGMEARFKEEISKLGKRNIDVAFIPVDQRLEAAKYLSIDYLMENAAVERVCPIHFWDDWNFIRRVSKDLSDRSYYDKIYFYGRQI